MESEGARRLLEIPGRFRLPILAAALLVVASLAVTTVRGMLHPVWRNRHGLLRVPWRMVLFALIAVAATAIVTLLAGPLRRFADAAPGAPGIGRVPLPLVAFGYPLLATALLAASAISARFLDRRGAASIGLGFHSRWRREFGMGLALGTAFVTAVTAALLVSGGVHFSFSGAAPAALGRGFALYLLLFAGVSLVEELLFRGFPLQVLAEGIGKIPAAILLSAPFGVIHFFNRGGTAAGALSTGVAGLLLSAAYFRTRSLWLPVGMHFSWNLCMGWVFGLPVSGERLGGTLLIGSPRGPAWLSGGEFGPEGSILAFLAMALLILAVLRSRRFGPSPEAAAWYPPPGARKKARDKRTPPPEDASSA